MSVKTEMMFNDLRNMKSAMDLLELKIKAILPAYKQLQEEDMMELKSMPYGEYLQTSHWQAKRREALEHAKKRCQYCGARAVELHVHHKTYERRGDERMDDLIVLCKDCHAKVHKAHYEITP